MVRTVAVALLSLSLVACSDDVNENNTARADAADVGNLSDAGQLEDADIRDAAVGGDAGSTDGGADGGEVADANSMDMDAADADQADMSSADMGSADSGQDAANADMSSTDGGSGGYDTTGWNMKRWTKSESASSGTPDSYFFDVDAGSPISASIIGGGSGTWSVNVFGGITNNLYCSVGASCQVMLDPQDTVVIVTAITTDIGGYTLTVDYAGQGPR